MSALRQGDISLYATKDGGEIKVFNGEPVMDGGFRNAVYLSLFGHDTNLPLWMSEYMKKSEVLGGKFYTFMKGNAKSANNILKAEGLALQDLQWFLDDSVADKINVEIFSVDIIDIILKIEILANGETIFENKYQINWSLQEITERDDRTPVRLKEVAIIDAASTPNFIVDANNNKIVGVSEA